MAIDYKDYYAILGVRKEASPEEIKSAYRRLAKEHHPDLHPEKDKAKAGEKFKEINEAYEVLSDPQKKAKYDQVGPGWEAPEESAAPGGRGERYDFHAGEWGGSASGFSDFFEQLFGQAGGRGFGAETAPLKGQDVEAELPLSLEDAFRGGDKRITIMAPALCPACGGSGRRAKGFCPACGGVGEVRREKAITAHLPAHIEDGMKLRLRGQAGAAAGVKEPGDLFLRIRLLPHPRYKVSGSDLETSFTVMPWVAALGGEAEVSALDGPVRIKIPAGTHAGRSFRIAGKGLGHRGGSRGDLYAVARIDIPQRTDERLERLYKEMKEAAA